MNNKIIEDVAKKFNMSVEDVKKHSKEVPEIDGYYFWNPVRGGNSIIINKDGEKLGATSPVNFEEHLKAFKEGERDKMSITESKKHSDRLKRKYDKLVKRIDLFKLAELIKEPLIKELSKYSYTYSIPYHNRFEFAVPNEIVLNPSNDIKITVYFHNLYTDRRVGSAGAWGANMGIDVTYQGKRITAQDTFVMHCSEENIRYAEEQVKMFEEVYNKVKEIYSDEG
jgi:hypothetical protein